MRHATVVVGLMFLAVSDCALAQQPVTGPPQRIGELARGDRVALHTRGGKSLTGSFEDWSPDTVRLMRRDRLEPVKFSDVEQIVVRRKAKRWTAALVGVAVGFGIAFPIGAASAGYVMDKNNPTLGDRVGLGTGFGLFAGGIGAGLGALFGGSRYETVYKAR